jgi:hypothetical protein
MYKAIEGRLVMTVDEVSSSCRETFWMKPRGLYLENSTSTTYIIKRHFEGYYSKIINIQFLWFKGTLHVTLKKKKHARGTKTVDRKHNTAALNQNTNRFNGQKSVSFTQTTGGSTDLWLHCWQAKHSRWYTLFLALITISKAGITFEHAAQCPVLPNNL